MEIFTTDQLGEACARLRANEVMLTAGYDGQFGEVHLFSQDELRHKKKLAKAKQKQSN